MGVCLTKNGNVYEKTSKAKVAGLAIGATTGGFLAHKNVNLIKDKVDDAFFRVVEEVRKSALDTTKSGLQGKIDANVFWDNLSKDGEILKYATKVANFVKKHHVAIGAGIGAVAFVCVGAIFDKISNNKKAKEADLKA